MFAFFKGMSVKFSISQNTFTIDVLMTRLLDHLKLRSVKQKMANYVKSCHTIGTMSFEPIRRLWNILCFTCYTYTENIRHINRVSRICQIMGSHFKRSVDTLITVTAQEMKILHQLDNMEFVLFGGKGINLSGSACVLLPSNWSLATMRHPVWKSMADLRLHHLCLTWSKSCLIPLFASMKSFLYKDCQKGSWVWYQLERLFSFSVFFIKTTEK